MHDQSNDRMAALHAWLAPLLRREGIDRYEIADASADASFRRYFRITTPVAPERTRIVMDAPPAVENCAPFVQVAGLMAAAGVHVPAIEAQDLAQGFLLLSDLGRETYLDVMSRDPSRVDALFRDANDTLVKWQLASRPDVLPEYDEATILRELSLFPDWYVARHLGVELTAAQRKTLDAMFALIARQALAQPRVYVHNDYMPRNLMVSSPNPGVLDFQDAVFGPISYDVASLYRDAFISWEEERVLDGTIRYWEKAKKAQLPVPAQFGDFYRDVEWMGLQRHLRIMGIFARIHYRDGKPHYLADTPRFAAYVRRTCERYGALAPLLRLFDELNIGETSVVGYTF